MKIKPLTIIRFGLAFAFLANSLTAFLAPTEFIELINSSFLSNPFQFIPISVSAFVLLIGLNDAVVATLLFLGGKAARVIAWWAMVWIAGVVLVKVTSGIYLESLEEIALLAMATALVLSNKLPYEP